ncbi:MAG TPA: hypothetical protein VJH33_03470 [Candidatus Paceibacterota bacterium]
MGDVVAIASKCLRLKFRKWETAKTYREKAMVVGPFRTEGDARKWYEELTKILDMDGDMVVVESDIYDVDWKTVWRLNMHSPKIATPPLIKDFFLSLEERVRKGKLKKLAPLPTPPKKKV